jgi:tetratricopeptide (TPR) repeat protein
LLAVDQVEMAQAALAAGRVAEARVLLEARPADARAGALLAQVYQQLKMPQKAAQTAQRAATLGPGIPAVQHTLALYYAQSGQRKLAALWEGRFAESKEADAAAPLRAALLYAELKAWPEVLRFGRLAISKEDRAQTRALLAQAAEASGKPDEAVEHYRAQVALSPYDEDAYSGFGQALLRMARFNDAAAFLEDAHRKFDKSPQLELALGVAYYAQRRFADAGSSFLRVIDLAPTVAQPYIFLAKMIDQLPARLPEILKKAEAWNASEKAEPFAPFVYARALSASGAPDAQVKPLVQQAIQRKGDAWEFSFELGQILERERDFTGAARAYETSISSNAKVPETHYRLARVYDRLSQPAKAAREREIHQQLLAAGGSKEGMR